ncbi:MAG TPA: group 1 truncated hemoglobin [Pyrinomonadaceae bacterium]|jgi:hemoglobin
MKKYALHLRLLLAFMLALLLVTSSSVQPQAAAQEKSLYERLGGYNAVAAVVDDFLGRLVADRRFERFFVGHSKDSQKRIRQHIVDQLCAAAGGPCVYTGRSMRDSHEGLNISEDDWKAAVDHLVASVDKFKVGKREKDDLLGAVSKFKPDIVEKR